MHNPDWFLHIPNITVTLSGGKNHKVLQDKKIKIQEAV